MRSPDIDTALFVLQIKASTQRKPGLRTSKQFEEAAEKLSRVVRDQSNRRSKMGFGPVLIPDLGYQLDLTEVEVESDHDVELVRWLRSPRVVRMMEAVARGEPERLHFWNAPGNDLAGFREYRRQPLCRLEASWVPPEDKSIMKRYQSARFSGDLDAVIEEFRVAHPDVDTARIRSRVIEPEGESERP